jgi:hypothetical protein
VDLLWGIAIVLSGLVAGGALNNAVAMVPALHRLESDEEAAVRPVTNTVADPALTALATLAGLAGLVLLAADDDARAGALVAALVLIAVAEGALYAARRARARWDALQLAAAAGAVGGFVLLVIARVP